MTDDRLIQELRELRYPGQVDVTEAVMAEVRQRPLLVAQPTQRRWYWKKISVAVAACVAVAVGLGVMSLFTQSFDEQQMASDIATVYDYHAGYAESDATYYESYLVDALLN